MFLEWEVGSGKSTVGSRTEDCELKTVDYYLLSALDRSQLIRTPISVPRAISNH
jgi:hypothetical protein